MRIIGLVNFLNNVQKYDGNINKPYYAKSSFIQMF